MDFRIAHRFPCSPQAYWETTRHPVYEQSLQSDDMDSEVLDRREDGDILTERMRMSPKKPLPPLLAKAIGRDRLSYVQEVAFNNAQLTTTWKVLSDVLSDKVKCSGRVTACSSAARPRRASRRARKPEPSSPARSRS